MLTLVELPEPATHTSIYSMVSDILLIINDNVVHHRELSVINFCTLGHARRHLNAVILMRNNHTDRRKSPGIHVVFLR